MANKAKSSVVTKLINDPVNQKREAYGKMSYAPMIDIGAGGNFGPRPDYNSWTSNQPYVRRNGIFILLEAPLMFNFLVDSDKYIESLTAMFELHSQTITGLSKTRNVETGSVPMGGGGEIMEVLTNVTVNPTELSIMYNELRGSPIRRMHNMWIEAAGMHHETKNPTIMFSKDKIKTLADRKGVTMTPEWYAATGIFIEPDPSGMACEDAWIIGNIFPKGSGDVEGTKDITNAMEVINHTIGYTGFSDISPTASLIGQALLDNINNKQIDPNTRKSFIKEVMPDIKAYGVNSNYIAAGSK